MNKGLANGQMVEYRGEVESIYIVMYLIDKWEFLSFQLIEKNWIDRKGVFRG